MEWFKHDINSLMDDRLSALVQRFAANGYAVYFCVVEALYANEGEAVGRLVLQRISKEFGIPLDSVVEICDYAASDDCDHLLHKVEGGYASERVCKAIQEKEEISRKRKENVRRRWDKYKSNKDLSSSDEVSAPIDMDKTSITPVIQMYNKCNTHVIQSDTEKRREEERRVEKNREDICSSSPSQGEVLHATDILQQEESTIVSSSSPEPEESDSTAEKKQHVFVEIEALQGKKVAIYESDVEKWQEAFPAVSVKDELRRAVVWLDDNPARRKTAGGMRRYLNSWLSRSQDRAARNGGGQSSDYIKGTDIRMTARAVGSDPTRYDKSMTFDDIYDRYLEGKRQGGAE